VPYFFEYGYENHKEGDINATEAMERMEEMLDHFIEHTCVEFCGSEQTKKRTSMTTK
jgi:hypothetical protein